jgi:hypothetical protein
VVVELGSWLGLSARHIFENGVDSVVLFAIDMWDTRFCLEDKKDQYVVSESAMMVLENVPSLLLQFQTNLWEYRHQLFPVKLCASVSGCGDWRSSC